VKYKHDDRLNADGRLIHQAAGVLHAASLVQQNADRAPSRREREMLEALADEIRDLAYDMRQHHNRLTQAK